MRHYVGGDPVNATDPSGFVGEGIVDEIKSLQTPSGIDPTDLAAFEFSRDGSAGGDIGGGLGGSSETDGPVDEIIVVGTRKHIGVSTTPNVTPASFHPASSNVRLSISNGRLLLAISSAVGGCYEFPSWGGFCVGTGVNTKSRFLVTDLTTGDIDTFPILLGNRIICGLPAGAT